MGRKVRGCCAPFWRGELDFHLTHYRLGRGLLPYQAASWSIQRFGHSRHGPKNGSVPLWGRESWVPIWHSVAALRIDLYSRSGHVENINRTQQTKFQRCCSDHLEQSSGTLRSSSMPTDSFGVHWNPFNYSLSHFLVAAKQLGYGCNDTSVWVSFGTKIVR